MKTEEEARKNWCPFAKNWQQDSGPAYNRLNGQPPNTCLCIASECMAWRWEELEPFIMGGDGTEDYEQDAYQHFIGRGWRVESYYGGQPRLVPPETARGHCGLAGKP